MGQIENKLKDILDVLKAGGGGSGEIPYAQLHYFRHTGEETVYYAIDSEETDCVEKDVIFFASTTTAETTDKGITFIPSFRYPSLSSAMRRQYTVVRGGRVGYAYASKEGNMWVFYSTAQGSSPANFEFMLPEYYLPLFGNNYPDGSILTKFTDPQDQRIMGTWDSLQSLFNQNEIATSLDIDFSSFESVYTQIITAIKQYASATPETTITKYVSLSGEQAMAVGYVIAQVVDYMEKSRGCVTMKLLDGIFMFTEMYAPSEEGYESLMRVKAQYHEINLLVDKIYDMYFIFTTTKVYIQCTCHEATSLM